MTWTTFFACALTAYGPPLALFFYGIAPSAQLVLLFLAASFTWLISILFSSIITIPLQNTSAFNIFIAVSAQEVFRYLYYRVLMYADIFDHHDLVNLNIGKQKKVLRWFQIIQRILLISSCMHLRVGLDSV
jgi:hypothetical protein